ncbi:MAG: SagB/ThcOx family dehydrogenase [Sedimentisphaerales bacterium]|nr:SagB/ThcOx family dehydrogenase [Sedimentisphaerales bacterium]
MNIIQNIGKLMVITAILAVLIFIGVSPAHQNIKENEISISERFHRETSITEKGIAADKLRLKPKEPPPYKVYPNTTKIELPKPKYTGVAVEDALKKRRSVRNYSAKPISKAQLSQLLFAAQGVTGKMYGQVLRTAPSAGALYPFEVYIIVNNVQDLPRGIYHYSILDHTLELVKSGDFRNQIIDAGLSQQALGDAGATFMLSAIFDRARHKYGERGCRYVYMEAGHISQNIYLQAVSLGLGSVCIGAFSDEKVNKLIDADGWKEAVIYLHPVGTL